MHARTSFFVTACLTLVAAVAAAQTFPSPTGRISDFAQVIDAQTEAQIDRDLDQLEQQTSSEIAVATVTSLEGLSVEEYANRLFQQWGIGRAKDDNGVLVLVAPADHKMRIEVGYGLEGVLPDGLAGQIIREAFTPRFKADDYSGGIQEGVARLIAVVQKHQVLTPEELAAFNASNTDDDLDDVPAWVLLPFLGLFVTIGVGMAGLGVRMKVVAMILFGGLFGGVPLAMGLVVTRTAWYTLLPWALFIGWAGYRLGGRESWRNAFRDRGGPGGGSSSGWTMGATGGGGGSRSSSSHSSSSSFGGGSSGGGGASGSW